MEWYFVDVVYLENVTIINIAFLELIAYDLWICVPSNVFCS